MDVFLVMCDFKLVTEVLYENRDLHLLHRALLSSSTEKKFQISDFFLFIVVFLDIATFS
jgi:hypothetical protein